MASATVEPSASDNVNHLHADSLPLIDLRLLSQSELLSLSLCCSSSSSLIHYQNDDDVATPKIDRSVFNESAGSRKQTFSRLRLAPRNNSQFAASSSSVRTSDPYQTTEKVLDDEDSQIISSLKSFFGSHSGSNNNNDINLVSVPIQYNESMGFLDFPSTRNEPTMGFSDYSGGTESKQAIQTANADPATTKKRKRGRPKQNDGHFYTSDSNNVSFLIESESKQIKTKTVDVNDNLRTEKEKQNPKENGEVLTMDNNGTAVDSVPLAGVEDPFAEELRRRTMGMHTEEQLLGFLQGLEGQWVNSRKKKKTVDASMLGNVLPRGWKLMLCIRRKAGCFWIACRRYISPNGQQFISCKEVSSYLLPPYGNQDANKLNSSHVDGNCQLIKKISSGNAAGVNLEVDQAGDDVACCLALPVTSRPVEGGNQSSSLNIGNHGEVQSVGKYKCHKCTMAFDEPDDLLQHLLSSHQRAPKRLRHATPSNEEVIIKNGRYECQFCLKSFDERHRYNGHLGNHIKDYFKRIGTSVGSVTAQRITISESVGTHHDVIQESIGTNMDSIAINSDIKPKDVISSTIMDDTEKVNTVISCGSKQDTFCKMANDKEEKMSEVTDVNAVQINAFLGIESVLLNNKNDSVSLSSGETNVSKCPILMINNFDTQKEGSQNHSLLAIVGDEKYGVDSEDQVRLNLEEDLRQKRGSGSCSLALNSEEKEVDGETMKDISVSTTINGTEIDDRVILAKEKLISGFDNNCLPKENAATNIKDLSSEGTLVVPSGNGQGYVPIYDVYGLSESTVVEKTNDRVSKGGIFSSVDEKMHVCNTNVSQVSSDTVDYSEFDESVKSKNSDQTIHLESNKMLAPADPTVISELGSSCSHSVILSRKDQITSSENNMHCTSTCTKRKHCIEDESEVNKLNLFVYEQSLSPETVKVPNGTMEVLNQNEALLSNKSKCGQDVAVVEGCPTDFEGERSCKNVSTIGSTNEPAYASKVDLVQNGASEILMQDRIPESSLHEQSCDRQDHNSEDSTNKVPSIITDQQNHTEFKSSCNVDPNIAFEHSHTGQRIDVLRSTMEENCSKDCSLFISGNQQNFVVETGLCTSTLNQQKRSSVESSLCLFKGDQIWGIDNNLGGALTGKVQEEHILDDLNRRKNETLPSAESSLCLSKGEQVWSVDSNSNTALTSKVQEEPILDDLNPGKNETSMGFSTYSQTENALSGFVWRTDEENDPLRGFADTSSQLVHSSSYFPAYNVMLDKGESELFREKLSGISGFDGMRSSGVENMEYNFITAHSNGPKNLSYDAGISQGLDSSVWLEKPALPFLPKTTSRHHVPALCVWCRNEFHYEAIESEAQLGSMGLTCSTCKAKFSGGFNLL